MWNWLSRRDWFRALLGLAAGAAAAPAANAAGPAAAAPPAGAAAPGPADHVTTHITTYTYDPGGYLTAVTDPLGHVTTYRYDAMG